MSGTLNVSESDWCVCCDTATDGWITSVSITPQMNYIKLVSHLNLESFTFIPRHDGASSASEVTVILTEREHKEPNEIVFAIGRDVFIQQYNKWMHTDFFYQTWSYEDD